MGYTTLFFDLDNTLLDFYKAEEKAIAEVLKEFSLPFDTKTVELYSSINSDFWKRFERGEIPKTDIFEGRFKTLLSVLNEKRNTEKLSDSYIKNLAFTYFKVDGADEILDYLKNKGYKIYATTNGFSFTQFNRVKQSGLEPYFSKVFVSEDVGAQKPEKKYFEECISAIDEKNTENILVIGDSQSSDILGGINAGLDTCWFNPMGEEQKYYSKYQIKKLTELKNIL